MARRPIELGWRQERLLKADFFSLVELGRWPERWGETLIVRRDAGAAVWWIKPLAYPMIRKEVRALRRLTEAGFPHAPHLLHWDGRYLCRSWHEGEALKTAQVRDPAFYRAAFAILRKLHRLGVAHNDLAKEPNWLITASGAPFLIDFQLAKVSRRRSWLFRRMAREDLRYLLKHKRKYCPEAMTAREQRIVATRGLFSRVWRKTGKKLYNFVTRKVLGWEDAEGEGHYKRYAKKSP